MCTFASSLLFAPAGALVLTSLQNPRHEASALVLMSRQSLAASLTGTPDVVASQDAARYTQTQAHVALIPAVASRVVTAAGLPNRTAQELLGPSDVSASRDSGLLEFRVWDRYPEIAQRLATAYAREFTLYRVELDTAADREGA